MVQFILREALLTFFALVSRYFHSSLIPLYIRFRIVNRVLQFDLTLLFNSLFIDCSECLLRGTLENQLMLKGNPPVVNG